MKNHGNGPNEDLAWCCSKNREFVLLAPQIAFCVEISDHSKWNAVELITEGTSRSYKLSAQPASRVKTDAMILKRRKSGQEKKFQMFQTSATCGRRSNKYCTMTRTMRFSQQSVNNYRTIHQVKPHLLSMTGCHVAMAIQNKSRNLDHFKWRLFSIHYASKNSVLKILYNMISIHPRFVY